MPIPNVANLYQIIGKGAEGGHEFARVLNQLIIAEANERGLESIISSDASGDYKGVDSILKERWRRTDNFIYTGFQYKFYPSNLTTNHKADIKLSLERVIDKFPEMSNWILVTPEDFSKNDMRWFELLKKEYEYKVSMIEAAERFMNKRQQHFRNDLSISHWGHTKLISLMLKHPEIGRHYYSNPFFIKEEGSLSLSKISVDTQNTIWHRSEEEKNYFIQEIVLGGSSKSSELIFDFQFINNVGLIHHLQQIDIIIEKIWTQLSGFPSTEVLQSIGTIEFEMDFNKQTNSIILDDVIGGPILFGEGSKRFKLQLNNFARKCPGNMAKIRFEFIFNDKVIKSEIITLSF